MRSADRTNNNFLIEGPDRVRFVLRGGENPFAEFRFDVSTGHQNAGATANVLGQQGSSPDQMHHYQTRAVEAIAADPNVELAVTVTGLSGFMQSNQGFMFAMLKDPRQPPPRAGRS